MALFKIFIGNYFTMKNELVYETLAQFTVKEGNTGNVTSVIPGLACVLEDNKSAHFNKVKDNLTILLNVPDVSAPTKICNVESGITTNLVKAYVDHEEVPVSSITSEYQFETPGLHTILLRYSTLGSLPESCFTQCTNIVNMKIPDSVTGVGRSAFCGCTGLTKFKWPSKTRYMYGDTFSGCTKLERIYFNGRVYIAGGQNEINQFKGCGKLRHVYFDTLDNLMLSSFYGTQNESFFYHPCSQSKEGHLYIGGEEVFDVTIPNGYSTINNSNFAFYKYVTAVTFSSDVKTISNASFYRCGLKSIVLPEGIQKIRDWSFKYCTNLTGPLILPNSLTTMEGDDFYGCTGLTSLTLSESLTGIPDNCFYNCISMAGPLVIPNSVKSISGNAFYNCSGFTGDLIVPDSVKSIGKSVFHSCSGFDSITITGLTSNINGGNEFAYLKNGVNLTLKTTGWVAGSSIQSTFFGRLNVTCSAMGKSSGGAASANTVTWNGNLSWSNANLSSSFFTSQIIRVTGNLISTNPVNMHVAKGDGRLKFFELMGTVAENFGSIAEGDNSAMSPSGCIYHFGNTEIACPASKANVTATRLTKIYVGPGESQEGDQEVLDKYLADQDWAPYASLLDLWHNYEGEYKE